MVMVGGVNRRIYAGKDCENCFGEVGKGERGINVH
jgi:hypothetical protein